MNGYILITILFSYNQSYTLSSPQDINLKIDVLKIVFFEEN